MTVLAVVGAQFGSEGKGAIVHHLADRFDVHVRVGGPNAGHTFWHNDKMYKMRAVPCGWTNLAATLVIGRGAIINPKVLQEELAMIANVDPTIWDRIFVDAGAWCIDLEDVEAEALSQMGPEIGSTLEGVGAARVQRLLRKPSHDRRFENEAERWDMQSIVHPDTAMLLNWYAAAGRNVLLEGTQGFGLSLLHGEWPYVTSADTTAWQLSADCGLGFTDVLLVMRTFPIRVGGNSGPLRGEMTWDELSEQLGRNVKEYTTVTKRLRRVGAWDNHLITQARVLNGAKRAALMFADYLDARVYGQTQLTPVVEHFVRDVERVHHLEIKFVGMGPSTIVQMGEWPWP